MNFTLSHVLRVAPATFWRRISFDATYHRPLYAGLRFSQVRGRRITCESSVSCVHELLGRRKTAGLRYVSA